MSPGMEGLFLRLSNTCKVTQVRCSLLLLGAQIETIMTCLLTDGAGTESPLKEGPTPLF